MVVRDGTRVLRTIARERRRLRRARAALGVPRPVARTVTVQVTAPDPAIPGLFVTPSTETLRHEAEQS